jgi:outer membrane protein assembly factor BamB
MCFRQTLILVIVSLCALAKVGLGGDWPQILGPQRNGIAVDEILLDEWPDSGPKEVWQANVGQGFAGVAVHKDVVYVFHRVDRVFVFGVEGILRCLKLTDGSEVWSRNTAKEYKSPDGYFGVGSTPVLHDDKLIVNVGGRKDAAVVAFSATDGKTVWKSFSDTASYSAPVVADIDGTLHALVVTRYHVVSLDPSSGKIRFQFPFGMRGPTVNGATPVIVGNHLFVSSSYRVGSIWAKIGSGDPKLIASGETLLATQYATPIEHNGLLYAVDGRQDSGDASVKCIDPSAQKVLWQKDGFQYGSLIRVNADLVFLTCGGELIRVAADRSGYRQLHKSKVLNPTPRGYRLPAISNGRLFVRDDRVLKCLQVGKTR